MQEPTQQGGAGWWAELSSHGRMIVVLWSVIIAAIAVFHYVGVSAPDVYSTRVDGVASSIDVLDHGGLALLVSDETYHRGIDPASDLYWIQAWSPRARSSAWLVRQVDLIKLP
jgi:hypothetical protein